MAAKYAELYEADRQLSAAQAACRENGSAENIAEYNAAAEAQTTAFDNLDGGYDRREYAAYRQARTPRPTT